MVRYIKEQEAQAITRLIISGTEPEDVLEAHPDYIRYSTNPRFVELLGRNAGLVPAFEASVDGWDFDTSVLLANHLVAIQENNPQDKDFALVGAIMADALETVADEYLELAVVYPKTAPRKARAAKRRADRLETLAVKLDPEIRTHFKDFVAAYLGSFDPTEDGSDEPGDESSPDE